MTAACYVQVTHELVTLLAAGCCLQGLMVAELVLERVAATVKASPLAVREPLLYRDGDVTHFGMVSREHLVLTREGLCKALAQPCGL